MVFPSTDQRRVDWHWRSQMVSLQETELAEMNWETGDLLYIPVFIGPADSGHWIALVVDRRSSDGTGIVTFADRHFANKEIQFESSFVASWGIRLKINEAMM
jgi:hypothetical protein